MLASLVVAGALLRLKGLTFQSLWLDELHTMIETNPVNPFQIVIGFMGRTAPHPPLYFLLIHFWFKLLGYNDYTARLLSVVAGTASIPCMYFLGKELYNKTTGYFSAAFATFNYYNIYYSQEARPYIFAFLFTTLSFLFLIRSLRNGTWKSTVWYAAFTTLLLYTHYYGLIIFACQMAVASVLLFTHRASRRALASTGISFLVVILLYVPWIGRTIALSNRTSFWITSPEPAFVLSFFREYFGGDLLSIYSFAVLLLLSSIGGIALIKRGRKQDEAVYGTYVFSMIVLLIWISVSYLLPYVKSLVSIPILIARYTIVTLPAILVAAAIGVEVLRVSFLKVAVVMLTAAFALLFLFGHGRYYEKPTKAQWREMQSFVVSENARNFPMISDRQWYLSYYFDQFHETPRYVTEDDLPRLHHVWVITGHRGNPLSAAGKEKLGEGFKITKSFTGINCSAVLYAKRRKR